MTEDFDNELLSALLDGELTPEQQWTLEARVDGSEALKAELAELERLSALIGDVAPASAPADLVQQVMSQVLKPQPGTNSNSPGPGSVPVWKRWPGLAAMLTAAAVLFLMFRLTGARDMAPNAARSVASRDTNSAPGEAAPVLPAAGAMKQSYESAESRMAADALVDKDASADLETDQIFRIDAITREIAGEAVAVIRVETDKRNAVSHLQTLLAAHELVAHREPENEVLTGQGLAAVSVEVSQKNLRSMLGHVEAETGLDSLSVVRDTSEQHLKKRLLAAIALAEGASSVTGKPTLGGTGTGMTRSRLNSKSVHDNALAEKSDTPVPRAIPAPASGDDDIKIAKQEQSKSVGPTARRAMPGQKKLNPGEARIADLAGRSAPAQPMLPGKAASSDNTGRIKVIFVMKTPVAAPIDAQPPCDADAA